MSSPIPIPSSRTPSSSGLYIPIHRRNPSTGSYSSSRTPSPARSLSSVSSSSRGLSPSPISPHSTSHHAFVYTPADLLSLAHSPLAQQSEGEMDARLRAIAPEVVQTRKQRKALAWHARHPTTGAGSGSRPRRSHAHAHTSESDEDRTTSESWRRA